MGRILLGISGKKASGKDTIAEFLIKNYNFTRIAFADPIKEMGEAIFGWSMEQMNDRELKEEIDPYWGFSPRTALQAIGTNLFRNNVDESFRQVNDKNPGLGRDIWIKAARVHMLKLFEEDENARVVITDVRFENEAKAISQWGGQVIRVAPAYPGYKKPDDEHESEIELDDYRFFDHILSNENTLEDLEKKALDLVMQLGVLG